MSISLSSPTSGKLPALPVIQSRYWIGALALVQAAVCIWLLQGRFWDAGLSDSCAAPLDAAVVPTTQSHAAAAVVAGAKDTLNMPVLLKGGPASAFRENLRPDVKYITSWPANGWSNQIIEFMHLLYLARLTERVPIIPRFRAGHMDGSNGSDIDFSAIFDLPRLRKELRTPILEWKDVKDIKSEDVEDLGCWDIHHKTWESEAVYLEAPVDTKLDLSYTQVPVWVRTALNMDSDDLGMLMWPLASLVSFSKRATSLKRLPDAVRSPLHDASLSPDDHLFCCNSLYFDLGTRALNSPADLSVAWQAVGRHMRWTPEIEKIAASYTRTLFGVKAEEQIPPYIAVHVRRGDFAMWCTIDGVPPNQCFAPLSAYERRVREVRAEIVENTGVSVEHVVITSDEEDPEWWEPVQKLGWVRPDHAKTGTSARYGPWYPIIIDAAIQGAAYGFVGTDTSSVSILARRRVTSRGGVAEMVKWGRPQADDH